MAKKNTTIKSTTPADTDTNIDNDEDGEDTAPVEKVDKAQAAALLAAYITADSEVTKVEEQLDLAKKSRSETVKKIHDALGKGPFKYKDHYLGKIVVRDNNYFFRGRLDSDIMSFD